MELCPICQTRIHAKRLELQKNAKTCSRACSDVRNKALKRARETRRRATEAGKAARAAERRTVQWKALHLQAVHRRNARKINQMGNVSFNIVETLMHIQKGKCWNCKQTFSADLKPQLDHYVPLAKGGLHDDRNLGLLCVHCNQTKWAKDPLVFARENGRLL